MEMEEEKKKKHRRRPWWIDVFAQTATQEEWVLERGLDKHFGKLVDAGVLYRVTHREQLGVRRGIRTSFNKDRSKCFIEIGPTVLELKTEGMSEDPYIVDF